MYPVALAISSLTHRVVWNMEGYKSSDQIKSRSKIMNYEEDLIEDYYFCDTFDV
jgi:hypothetical protein